MCLTTSNHTREATGGRERVCATRAQASAETVKYAVEPKVLKWLKLASLRKLLDVCGPPARAPALSCFGCASVSL